jgi:hypothetical protein
MSALTAAVQVAMQPLMSRLEAVERASLRTLAAAPQSTRVPAVTRGLRVLREQLFLRLLLTTRRASEYTLDFRELPRYVEAKLT